MVESEDPGIRVTQLLYCHVLGKVAATKLAELGASEFQLMAVMGWSNPATAIKYTEKAQRRIPGGAAIVNQNWNVN